MRTAIVSGMFDPFTRGHENLVRRALDLFDQVVIVVSRNGEKQGFLPDRVKLDSIWACFPDKRVQVVLLEGLLAEFVKQFPNYKATPNFIDGKLRTVPVEAPEAEAEAEAA